MIQYYSNATVFCCPSVYEPFGIINLEAMACETAVVASAVGGIPEVVVPEETGLLVDLELKPGTFDPVDPAKFSRALAEGINAVALNPALRAKYRAQRAHARRGSLQLDGDRTPHAGSVPVAGALETSEPEGWQRLLANLQVPRPTTSIKEQYRAA